jgi:hypothetical protein
MRVVADTPTLNTRQDQSDADKTKTWVERIFMEAIGVVAGFMAISLGQDVAAKAVEWLDKSVHPTTLLSALYAKTNVDEATLANLSRAFLMSYLPPHQLHTWLHQETGQAPVGQTGTLLKQISPKKIQEKLSALTDILNVNLYGAGKLNHIDNEFKFFQGTSLAEALKPHPEAVTKVNTYFAANNIKTNFFVITGGLMASTYFSGILWQQLNDNLIRKKVSPVVTKWVRPLFFPSQEDSSTTSQLETRRFSPMTLHDKQLSESLLHPPAVHVAPTPSLQFSHNDVFAPPATQATLQVQSSVATVVPSVSLAALSKVPSSAPSVSAQPTNEPKKRSPWVPMQLPSFYSKGYPGGGSL